MPGFDCFWRCFPENLGFKFDKVLGMYLEEGTAADETLSREVDQGLFFERGLGRRMESSEVVKSFPRQRKETRPEIAGTNRTFFSGLSILHQVVFFASASRRSRGWQYLAEACSNVG